MKLRSILIDVKSDLVASAGVLCGNARGIVLLVKGRMLAGFTVPLLSWLQGMKRFEWRSLNCMLIVYGLKETLWL